jgi:mannose-6-phosphate isomerase-like protein (cupin superfamily)
MRLFFNKCRVTDPDEGGYVTEGSRRYRRPISRRSGSVQIAQTISHYGQGSSPARQNPVGDEVHYVVRGRGAAWIDGTRSELEQGTAVYTPAGSVCAFENTASECMEIVSVTCPEDDEARMVEADFPVKAQRDGPVRTIHERDARSVVTGDRLFKLLVEKDFGCERITQFIGVIPRSRAAQHHHSYEEAIYILDGRGLVWSGDQSCEFVTGTSIYLPVGAKHSLENPYLEPVRLLGVFYPSGSPAVNYRD